MSWIGFTGSEKKFIINELKEQIGNLQQDLDERGDAFEKLYEEHKQTIKVSIKLNQWLSFCCLYYFVLYVKNKWVWNGLNIIKFI